MPAIPLHATRAIRSAVRTLVLNVEGALGTADLAWIAERVFRFGSSEKVLRCGWRAYEIIDAWTAYANEPEQRSHVLATAFGTLGLMRDPTIPADEAWIDDPTLDPTVEENERAFAVIRGVWRAA